MTVFRTSRDPAPASSAPHPLQKRALSAFAWPQLEHIATVKAYSAVVSEAAVEGLTPTTVSQMSPVVANGLHHVDAFGCRVVADRHCLPFALKGRDDGWVHRKFVTMLFCDVVGSTALGGSVDPEALQALLARYFERMKTIVESHGGSVEKFIGDAVMAVFGVPQVHEDDALRACRAAVEMREAFPELGVQGRIGVNTGEVVVGTAERLATGDAVNVAARLQQAARPNEILIGEATHVLVVAAV
ncbi:MAG TPA: adenylate/guanylate cyclase domain-containing protein, partial [Gaiellaceae bacterium]|nr:adenylate/guanylate cyclase domain-containing protein [Gaiellaceae bacterium]